MNKLDVNQAGGFPLTTRILDELQKISAVFNGLGGIAGDKTILYGCTLVGSTVSNGVVYVNGEVFEFRGGLVQSKVIVKEDPENLVFENNESKTVIRTRYVTFGTGVNSMDWSDFIKPKETKGLEEALNGKTDFTTFEALADAFAIVYAKMLTVEEGAQKNQTEFYDFKIVPTQNRQQGINDNDFTKNFYIVNPPEGFTMAHLKGFTASIAKIAFDGVVDNFDTLWCKYLVGPNNITITCQNAENRAVSEVSYLAIWKKQ